MDNILYARGKKFKAGGWLPLNGFGTPITSFNFKSYDFRINGVVYKHESKRFDEALEKLQMWEDLGG